MIKEIKFPLPTIFEFKKPKKKKNIPNYIKFEKDISLVEEFAERANIDIRFAEDILTVFFDEIKTNLLNSKVVSINKYGKFYVGSTNRTQKQKGAIEVKSKFLYPKFMTGKLLKKILRELYK